MASGAATVTIMINGETIQMPAGASVADALAACGAPKEGSAVERNGAIVPRSRHASTPIEEGDKLEVVTFVGGG